MTTFNTWGSQAIAEVAKGGTSVATLQDHGVMVGSATSAVTALAVGTNGQLLIGSSGTDPVFGTVTSSDSSITWTPTAGGLDGVANPSGALTINAQTGTTYTLVLTDASKLVTLTNAAAIALTIPPNSSVAFPTGSQILLQAGGAGTVTVGPGSGVTLNSRGSVYDSAGQYAMMSIIKTATDTWQLSGDIA